MSDEQETAAIARWLSKEGHGGEWCDVYASPDGVGYRCSLAPGHDGDHMACGIGASGPSVLVRWTR